MFKKCLLLCFTLLSIASAAERTQILMTNGYGVTFSSLGKFETTFLDACDEIAFSEDNPSHQSAKILHLGAGDGRMALKTFERAGDSLVYVNDLSGENLSFVRNGKTVG